MGRFLAVLTLVAASHLPAQSAPAEGPAAVVEALYRRHFAVDQRFDDTVRAERSRFTPALLALLDADMSASASSPDEIVGLDFDPFTNAQEEASGYRVGKPTFRGDVATVPVDLDFGGESTAVVVHLVKSGGRWVISDFDVGEQMLAAILKRLAADRAR